MDKLITYVFQLIGENETCEIEAEDSAQAFRRCLRDKKWPIERVMFLGQKEEKRNPGPLREP
jgi:hypothetical protein